jgi:hypothetical protein
MTMRALIAIALLGAAAAGLRFDLIENEALAPLCLEAEAPGWCGPAGIADNALRHWLAGAAAVASAVLGLRHGGFALLAMAVGIVGTAFGHAFPNAPAALAGLLLWQHHRHRQQQAQRRPA